MENTELDLTMFGFVVVIIIILFLIIRKKKDIKMTGADLGPLNIEFSEKSAEIISVLSSPIAACRGDKVTPTLKVKVMDEEQHILKNKKVKLEIYGENGIVSTRKISGILTKSTDNDGIAVFNDIIINTTGTFRFFILCEKKQVTTDDIDILPPGLPIDFWNYHVGSPEYEERLDRILRFKSKNS